MARPMKAVGLGPPEEPAGEPAGEDEGGDDPIADALEIALGKRPSADQVEAFCMACKLASDYEA